MNSQTLQVLDHVLQPFPQIEQANPKLTAYHNSILEYLSTKRSPTRTKKISEDLGINFNSCRRLMSELLEWGYVMQPGKFKVRIADLSPSGKININTQNLKCGYVLFDLTKIRQ